MRSTFFTILAFFLVTNAIADTEPNNDWQSAQALPQDRTIAGVQSDDDWYVINAAVGTRILIDLTFTHADGNIDLAFYGDDFVVSDPTNPVSGIFRGASAGNTSDHEFIDNDISFRGPGAYYIWIYGQNAGNSYTLTWTELATVTDDGFEVNNDGTTAKPITESVVAFGAQADEDWYSIEVSSGSIRVLASLRFYNTHLDKTIDLDLALRDAGGTVLAASTNPSGENEAIDFEVLNPDTYYLQVTGDTNGDGYALNWAGVSPTSSAVFPLPAVNEAPSAIANTVTTTENTAYTFAVTDFTFSDTEGDSLVSATLNNLSLGGGSLTHSGGTAVNNADTLSAAQLATLVYTPPADTAGSPLATFDFTVNDSLDAGTVAAQMGINVTAATTTTDTTTDTTTVVSTDSSSGALSPAWLLVLMLSVLLRRKQR